MLSELTDYYRAQGIAACDFRCRHLADCSRGAGDFVEAREPLVGDQYVAGELPRLLFLSLDPATDLCGRAPEQRTVAAVTAWEYDKRHPITGAPDFMKQSHWYKTYSMAHSILTPIARSRGKQPLAFSEMHRFFAHTNSAKCKDASRGTAQGVARIFRNCSEFIPGELAMLKPDIVVTQGKPAREAVHGRLPVVRRGTDPSGQYSAEVVDLGGHQAVKFETHHPNRKDASYGNEVRDAWPWYIKVSEVFAEGGASGLSAALGFREA